MINNREGSLFIQLKKRTTIKKFIKTIFGNLIKHTTFFFLFFAGLSINNPLLADRDYMTKLVRSLFKQFVWEFSS